MTARRADLASWRGPPEIARLRFRDTSAAHPSDAYDVAALPRRPPSGRNAAALWRNQQAEFARLRVTGGAGRRRSLWTVPKEPRQVCDPWRGFSLPIDRPA